MKKRFLFVLGLFLILGLGNTNKMQLSASETGEVSTMNANVTINDRKVNFNDQYGFPKLTKQTGRTLVPLRIISENMGYKVDWDNTGKTATIKGGGQTVQVTIGETTALVNGKRVPIDVDDNGNPLDTKAMLLSAQGGGVRTYVPLRFISEATGATIGYEKVGNVHTITIVTDSDIPLPDEDEEIPETEAGYVGNIYFDPETDLMEDGRLTHEKTREFLDEMLKNIDVYKEGGSYYLEWNEIPLPKGQTYGLGFRTAFNTPGTGLGHHLSTGNDPWMKEENKLPSGSFKYKLDNKKMSDIRFYMLSVSVRNPNSTHPSRKYSANYTVEYNPNTGLSEITPYNERGHIMESEPINKSLVFGPGL